MFARSIASPAFVQFRTIRESTYFRISVANAKSLAHLLSVTLKSKHRKREINTDKANTMQKNRFPQPAQRLFPLYAFIARARVIGVRATAEQMALSGLPISDALLMARAA